MFRMVLLEIFTAPVGLVVMLIPAQSEALVVKPAVPARILSAVVLPIVLPVIVSVAAAAETLMPKQPPATAAVAPALTIAPKELFRNEIAPVEEV